MTNNQLIAIVAAHLLSDSAYDNTLEEAMDKAIVLAKRLIQKAEQS